MKKQKLSFLLRSDLWRYYGKASLKNFLKCYFFIEGYKYSVWMRLAAAARGNIFTKILFYPFLRLMLGHYSHKYGIQIPCSTSIGPGFYIGHFNCIVVSNAAKIGKNCNISHGVTIGMWKQQAPVIGDNVYIAPGAKIIGGVTIGNNVEIGANAVVTHDIPDNEVWGGVPACKIGSIDELRAVNNIDYE